MEQIYIILIVLFNFIMLKPPKKLFDCGRVLADSDWSAVYSQIMMTEFEEETYNIWWDNSSNLIISKDSIEPCDVNDCFVCLLCDCLSAWCLMAYVILWFWALSVIQTASVLAELVTFVIVSYGATRFHHHMLYKYIFNIKLNLMKK